MKYDSSVIKRSNSRSHKLFHTFLKLNFSFINKIINYSIKKYLSMIGTTPTYRVYFPKTYYNEFKFLKFYHQKYKIPIQSEKHLERIYGSDWNTPIVTQNKSFFKKISYD